MSNYIFEHAGLQRRLDSLGAKIEIPALPDIYVRLREVISDPQGDSHTVALLLAREPSLVMKVLKTVNSAVYGLSRQVTKIEQAVALLGFNEICNLVLAATVIKQFATRPGDKRFDTHKFLEHLLAVAVITRVILKFGEGKVRASVEESFIGGLLHDVGKIILYQTFPAEYTRVLNLCDSEKLTCTKAETNVFQFSHQDIGAYVADEWGMSRNLVKAIESHNNPGQIDPDDESFPFLSLIHIADIFAHLHEFGFSGDPFIPTCHIESFNCLGLRAELLPVIYEESAPVISEVITILR